jgi:hypothetical protein
LDGLVVLLRTICQVVRVFGFHQPAVLEVDVLGAVEVPDTDVVLDVLLDVLDVLVDVRTVVVLNVLLLDVLETDDLLEVLGVDESVVRLDVEMVVLLDVTMVLLVLVIVDEVVSLVVDTDVTLARRSRDAKATVANIHHKTQNRKGPI